MLQKASAYVTTAAKLMIGAGVVALGFQQSLYNVDAGHRGLIFDRFQGIKNQVMGEGTHFYIPFIQTPIIYDVRIQPSNIKSTTGSKDLQNIKLTLRVLYRPDTAFLPTIFSQLGLDYADRILPSVGTEVMKAVVAQYNAEELITQREHISREIRERIVKRAKEFNIVLDDVALTHLYFSDEYTRAVEFKQVAQQDAERSKFIVDKAKQEKKAAIIKAEAEAEAAQLISAAMASGPAFIELRRIEAAREIAETLSSSKNVTYLPASANVLFGMH